MAMCGVVLVAAMVPIYCAGISGRHIHAGTIERPTCAYYLAHVFVEKEGSCTAERQSVFRYNRRV